MNEIEAISPATDGDSDPGSTSSESRPPASPEPTNLGNDIAPPSKDATAVDSPQELPPPSQPGVQEQAPAQTGQPNKSPTLETDPPAPLEEPDPNDVGFDIRFLDFAGQPIVGLQHIVKMKEKSKWLSFPGTTDAQGVGVKMSGMAPFTPVEVWVRKDNGELLRKYHGTVGCSDTSICAVSPHIKIKLKTEIHEGAPGTPPPKPVAHDLTLERRPNAPGAGVNTSGGKAADKAPTAARDKNGNPIAVLTDPTADCNDRHRIPTLGLWTWKDFAQESRSCTKPIKTPNRTLADPNSSSTATASTTATSKSSPTIGNVPAPVTVQSTDTEVPTAVTALISNMEQQVLWDWKGLMAQYGTTANIKIAIVNKTFTPPDATKAAGKSHGRCYPSVKLGLWRAHIVEGIDATIRPATEAGPWLLNEGFKNVTKEVPDARWALPGDIIVYEYDAQTLAANDKANAAAISQYDADLKMYPLAKKTYEEQLQAWKGQRQQSVLQTGGPSADAAHSVAHRKKPKGPPEPKLPLQPVRPQGANYGHIDVRTYDGYLSDFKRTTLPDSAPHGASKGFVVNGIYRKIFDPLPDVRVRAFLLLLASRESKTIFQSEGYQETYRTLPGKGKFSSFLTHPFAENEAASTASGAYGILRKTWKSYLPKLNLPEGSDLFSPIVQDRIAVSIMEENGALGLIRKGKVEEGAKILAGKLQWASLPGGGQEGGFTVPMMLESYKKFLESLLSN